MGIDCLLYAVESDQLGALKANPSSVFGALVLRGLPACDLHKAWHAIHFVLTGSVEEAAGPAGYLLCGGQELGEADDDCRDPARLLSPDEVLAFHQVLSRYNDLELGQRFNHQAMVAAGVYSIAGGGTADWDVDSFADEFADPDCAEADNWTLEEADDFEFIAHYFEVLRNFIAQAAAAGQGVVITIG